MPVAIELSCVWNSSRDSSRLVVGVAPPRGGGSRKLKSSLLMPASPETRSANASKRINCACISPSLTAMAPMFSWM